MYYVPTDHKQFASRCQCLTFSVLAAALLVETRGLLNDLCMARSRASLTFSSSGLAVDRGTHSGLSDSWPLASGFGPNAAENNSATTYSDDSGAGSTAQVQEWHPHHGHRRSDPKSTAAASAPRWSGRNRSLSRFRGSPETSLANNKTPDEPDRLP